MITTVKFLLLMGFINVTDGTQSIDTTVPPLHDTMDDCIDAGESYHVTNLPGQFFMCKPVRVSRER